jgi:hypothetical protein
MISKLVKEYPSGTTIKDIEKEIRKEDGYYTLVFTEEHKVILAATHEPNENDKLLHVHDTDSVLKVCADFEVKAKIMQSAGKTSWHEYTITKSKKENDNNEVQ